MDLLTSGVRGRLVDLLVDVARDQCRHDALRWLQPDDGQEGRAQGRHLHKTVGNNMS
jgi:hypothetical protein